MKTRLLALLCCLACLTVSGQNDNKPQEAPAQDAYDPKAVPKDPSVHSKPDDIPMNWLSVGLHFRNNPAFAGFQGKQVTTLFGGMPYMGVAKSPVGGGLSHEAGFKLGEKLRLAVGGWGYYEKRIFEKEIDAQLAASLQIRFNETHSLSIGAAGGIRRTTIDFFQMRFPNQINPFNPGGTSPSGENPIESQLTPYISAGIFYRLKGFTFGAAALDLTQPQNRFLQSGTQQNASTPTTINVHASYLFKVKGNFMLQPALYYTHWGSSNTFEASVQGIWSNRVLFGLLGRMNAVGIQAGYKIFPMLRVDYRYYMYVNDLIDASSGGHYLGIRGYF